MNTFQRAKLLDAFLQEVACPAIANLEHETCQPISFTATVVEQGRSRRKNSVSSNSDYAGPPVFGEIRVRFRLGENATSFWAQGIFQGLAEGTGFSGFSIQGKLPVTKDSAVRVIARVNTYNVWDWDPEFQY